MKTYKVNCEFKLNAFDEKELLKIINEIEHKAELRFDNINYKEVV